MECILYQQEEWFSMDFVHSRFTRYQLKYPKDNGQSAGENQTGSYSVTVNTINAPDEDQMKELTVFKDSILHQTTPLVDMEEAYFTVKILLEVMEKITKKA
jgi:hypothetical protein